MGISLEAIRVWTTHGSEGGRLAFVNDNLVAVLIHLAGDIYESSSGGWYVEASFGPCTTAQPPVFHALSDAIAWIDDCVGMQSSAKTNDALEAQPHV